ncbi:MAG: hypothetical protein ABUL50_08635, partial [Rhizobacter sp.]
MSTEFDPRSGSIVERALFNPRAIVVALCLLLTAILGWQATKLRLNASFEKTIPAHQPYIGNFLKYQGELNGLGNAVRIAVENPAGTIYEARYLDTLRKLSDEVFLVPGVARNQMKSLWTPTTRWVGVTEEGLEGGPVIPDGYDGSAASLEQLRANIARSGEIGQLVARDAKSSAIYVPLLAKDAEGRPLDYNTFAQRIEIAGVEHIAARVLDHHAQRTAHAAQFGAVLQVVLDVRVTGGNGLLEAGVERQARREEGQHEGGQQTGGHHPTP